MHETSVVAGKSTKETMIRRNGLVIERQTHVFTNTDGSNERIDRTSYEFDALGHAQVTKKLDPLSGRILNSSDWQGAKQVPGVLKLSETDEDGIKTIYTYDSLKRVRTITKEGVTLSGFVQADIVTTISYDAYGNKTAETVSAGGLSLASGWTYDKSGRLLSETTPAEGTTSHLYSEVNRTETTTYPGGLTRITKRYRDRELESVTGSAVVAEYHDHDTEAYGAPFFGRRFTEVYTGPANARRYTRQIFNEGDMLVGEEKPGPNGSGTQQMRYTYTPTTILRLQSITKPGVASGGVIETTFGYDDLGQQNSETLFHDTGKYSDVAAALGGRRVVASSPVPAS